MKTLNVNVDELIDAMDQYDRDVSRWYLDTATGQVLLVSTDFFAEYDDDEEEDESPDETMPQWQRKERELTKLIENGADGRFEQVPAFESRQSYALMEAFIGEVPDPRLRDRLRRAIGGKGAFRRFKDELYEHNEVRQRWFDFERGRKREWAAEWLAELEIETTWEPPVTKQKPADWQPKVVGVDHVQITIPVGAEQQAREFYCGLLGLVEIPKPEPLRARGGLWLQVGDLPVHIGTEDIKVREATKAHIAYLVTDLPKWRDRLQKAGIAIMESLTISGCTRFKFRDPFGNRVEFIQPTDPA